MALGLRIGRSSIRVPFMLAVGVAVLASGARPSAAQIALRVRAESRLELRVESPAEGVVLHGALRDDLGAPLVGRRIDVAIDEAGPTRRLAVETDEDGLFELGLEEPSGALVVRARFDGDDFHDGTEVERAIRAGLEDVSLTLTVPRGGVFDLDTRRHPVTIVARATSGPAPVRIELLDELGRRLGEGHANDLGRLRIELTSELLGPPGAARLIARSTGDARFAASQIEVPIVRTRPSRLELRASPRAAHASDTIRVEGRLFGSDGPRKHEAVGIFADERHVATVLTGDDGSFWAEAALPETVAETVAFSARYEPNGPGHGATASAPTFVRALTPSHHRWALRLLAPIALVFLWAGAHAARAGRARWVESRGATEAPRSRSDRFAAQAHALRGAVLGESDLPIAGARVRFRHAGGTEGELATNADGRFELPGLPRGDLEIVVDAIGHAASTSRRSLPVRARDAEIVVRLPSLRAVALAAFRRTAEPWLDSPSEWPTTTNAVAATRAPESTRPAAVALAVEVDRLYYGPTPPAPSDVEPIVRSAEEQRNNAEPLHRTR